MKMNNLRGYKNDDDNLTFTLASNSGKFTIFKLPGNWDGYMYAFLRLLVVGRS